MFLPPPIIFYLLVGRHCVCAKVIETCSQKRVEYFYGEFHVVQLNSFEPQIWRIVISKQYRSEAQLIIVVMDDLNSKEFEFSRKFLEP